jgi:hypothetical protein
MVPDEFLINICGGGELWTIQFPKGFLSVAPGIVALEGEYLFLAVLVWAHSFRLPLFAKNLVG